MQLPTMRVIRKQDGHDMVINESDFTEDHYERWKAPALKAGSADPEMVMVKNPEDKRQRLKIAKAVYEQAPDKWELWG